MLGKYYSPTTYINGNLQSLWLLFLSRGSWRGFSIVQEDEPSKQPAEAGPSVVGDQTQRPDVATKGTSDKKAHLQPKGKNRLRLSSNTTAERWLEAKHFPRSCGEIHTLIV
jgi:hypothetical protein